MKTIPWEVDEGRFSDAYVAGFFDGDGSLVATLEKQSSRYLRAYRPRIKINFTQHIRHFDTLCSIQKFLDAGKVSIAKTHHQAELVIVDRTEVSRILNRMLPHLVLKKRQAILALEALSQFGENLRTNRISDENYSAIIKIIVEIRNLTSNSGGKRKSSSFDPVTTSPLNRRESVYSSRR